MNIHPTDTSEATEATEAQSTGELVLDDARLDDDRPEDAADAHAAVHADAHDTEPDEVEPTVEVHRNGVVSAAAAGVAALVAACYLARAVSSGSTLDWLVCAGLAAIAAAHALSWRDARVPLLVADRTGIRVRLGRSWHGLPWQEIEEVEHAPRRGLLRDGRLVAFPVDAEALIDGLSGVARRQARISERVHGAPFAVPLGLTTSVVGADDGLTAALLALVPDPEMVVEVVPGVADDAVPLSEDDLTDTAERPALGADEHGDEHHDQHDDQHGDQDGEGGPAATPTGELPAATVAQAVRDRGPEDTAVRARPDLAPTPTPAPAREPVSAMRADGPSGVVHTAVRPLPTSGRLQREARDYFAGGPDDTGVWRSTTVVIDELAGPSLEPVIGPQLTVAREVLGLSIERLAERTRIRAHVIESIEVDDFEPCGGDFYARGHLRTLCRVLGVEAAPLLATYDEQYADAPVAARTVFEADLAGSSQGAIRSLRGGPNWSVLVAAVMAVVLLWSVARLVIDRPQAADDTPSLAGDSAGLTSGRTTLSPAVPVVLSAEGGGARVVVRDGAGAVVFKGTLAFGQSRTVKASPPVRVQSSDGSLSVAVDGADPAPMGRTGQSARSTYVPATD